ncbi:hypothetical protein K5R88_02830 [Pseudomonas sp. MM213]|nr:hypothetical protein K5R88_02830 [Pseudomonas sp. MM213]
MNGISTQRRLILTTPARAIPFRKPVHRLSNLGNIPLEVIDLQSGSYLGEDDIERLEETGPRADLDRR